MNLDDIRDMSAFRIAEDYANCAVPDSSTSAGAVMLIEIRDNLLTAINETPGITADDLRDQVGEILDGVVDYRTWQKWQQFVDLAAWQEEPEDTEAGWGTSEMDKIADAALYQIADRAVYALIGAWESDEDDE